MNNRVLLPGVTTLARMVAAVRLEVTRQTATLLATVRHLETATVDDALDLLHALMATKLLAKAERMGNDAKLKALPQLRKAAKKVAAAVDVLMTTPPATDTGELVSVLDAWSGPGQRRGRRRGMSGRTGRPLRHRARLHPPPGRGHRLRRGRGRRPDCEKRSRDCRT
ncbi:hypothetical protein [Microbispora sp. GKU 823]|uniref:hypothetical protein n=1 Tax=Microbispora sp. GKU 823 TaxID=1652100 RepID=UPI0021192AB0|nr:hypothetical protein [Microbispora sp. GKU 823]